ncbi:MAG: Fmu (Sun) domain-containing protein [Deltaproteobacteria bacterium]|jgi:16S rRNA (cytosine967-C5)-methyltransferase|nr:Fmu (Sun) domain-containing protein [Deltaproteobacteria bacterium]
MRRCSRPVFAGLRERARHDPRAASLLALAQVIHGRAEGQAALDRLLSPEDSGFARQKPLLLPPCDRALCTELFYGVLRHHLRLDWFLRQKLSRPEKLPPEFFLLLEQGAYSLAHTRIPPHASVNWAVNLAANRFGAGLGKVANAVLRDFARKLREEYLNPAFYAQTLGEAPDSAEALALFQAVPAWIARLWSESYGRENCLALLAAGLKAPPQGVRLNAARPEYPAMRKILEEQGASPAAPACWALRHSPESRPPLADWRRQGLASLQSPAACAALFSLEPANWPLPLWDACAGGGGKTLALLEAGIPVHSASDPSSGRLRRLRADFIRLGLDESLLPRLAPLRAEQSGFKKCFASILVDAPCSGLGTLGRRPEIRWRREEKDLEELIRLQAAILEAAAEALLPRAGCRILYLTCTLNPAENREQIRRFLNLHPRFKAGGEFQTPAASPLGEFFYAAELLRKE